MPIPIQTPYAQHTGNGVTTTFSYGFTILSSDDMRVMVDGVEATSGFSITGVGSRTGGTVVFSTAPANGADIYIYRDVALERETDYQENGDLAAETLDADFDRLWMAVQDIGTAGERTLRAPVGETLAELPSAALRASKYLAFDSGGNRVLISAPGASDASALALALADQADATKGAGMVGAEFTLNYAAKTIGAAVFDNRVNIFWFLTDAEKADVKAKTFGIDLTAKIQAVLGYAVGRGAYFPGGGYLHSSTIEVGYGIDIEGDGPQNTEFRATTAIVQFEMTSSYAGLSKLKISGDFASRTPTVGLKLYGKTSPCIHNRISGLVIESQQRGIVLDGYNNTANPCYWNNISEVLVLHPAIDGVLLTKSGAGDTPNANKFNDVHVYSNGSSISGSGFYIEHGNFWNTFTDCESGLDINTPTACFRVGANALRTIINTLYCETSGTIVNLQLDLGSEHTSVTNLLAASAGAAIYDLSGGKYTAHNAGFPVTHYSGRSVIKEIKTSKLEFVFNGTDATPATSTVYTQDYGNTSPSTTGYVRGSIRWNTNISVANGPVGWVCLASGTPDTWMPFGEYYLDGSATFNPGAIGNGAQSSLVTITVTGAALGDIVEVSNTVDMQGLTLFGYVSAANTVKVAALNLTGGSVTLSSGTVYARVMKR